MHSALSIASLFIAASSAIVLPRQATNATTSSLSSADTEVRVILQSDSTGSQTVFKNVDVRKHKAPVGSSGPFETIEINVGAGAQQDLRCQVLDMNGKPIIAKRNANVDITFSDADKGEWTFTNGPTEVSRIVCDPEFKAVTPDAFQVRVILQDQSAELGTQTVFDTVEGRVEFPPTGSQGPYDTVEISVGSLVDPALRCQLLNGRGRKITAVRKENTDTTFSDAGKGPWSFKRDQKVSSVICDPAFVAMPQ